MQHTTRDSSAPSQTLLSRQLAGIADTLARASRRRDEEVRRARGTSGVSAAAVNHIPAEMSAAPAQQHAVRGRGMLTPAVVWLRGGDGSGDGDGDADTPQERNEFERVSGDDPERDMMIRLLLARANGVELDVMKERMRRRSAAAEEAVSDEDPGREIDEFEALMLNGEEKDEEATEQADREQRLRRWEDGRRLALRVRARDWARRARTDFLLETHYAALFADPKDERAELARLEEQLFDYLVAQMRAQDARDVQAERARQRSAAARGDAGEKLETGAETGDAAVASFSGEMDGGLEVHAAALRGGAAGDGARGLDGVARRCGEGDGFLARGCGGDVGWAVEVERRGERMGVAKDGGWVDGEARVKAQKNEEHESMATEMETDNAQREASEAQREAHTTRIQPSAIHVRKDDTSPSSTEIAGTPADSKTERRRKIDEDFEELMAGMKGLCVGGAAGVGGARGGARTSGYAGDEELLRSAHATAAADGDLRAMLEELRTLSTAELRSSTAAPGRLDPETIPYAIALQLEDSGCEWEVVRGWTKYLFSSGLDSYAAQKEKEIAVARAEEALQKTIASAMEAETEHRLKTEEAKLQRRLVVSNLAAGADKSDIERQFRKHRNDM